MAMKDAELGEYSVVGSPSHDELQSGETHGRWVSPSSATRNRKALTWLLFVALIAAIWFAEGWREELVELRHKLAHRQGVLAAEGKELLQGVNERKKELEASENDLAEQRGEIDEEAKALEADLEASEEELLEEQGKMEKEAEALEQKKKELEKEENALDKKKKEIKDAAKALQKDAGEAAKARAFEEKQKESENEVGENREGLEDEREKSQFKDDSEAIGQSETSENETLEEEQTKLRLRVHLNNPAPRLQSIAITAYHKTGHTYVRSTLSKMIKALGWRYERTWTKSFDTNWFRYSIYLDHSGVLEKLSRNGLTFLDTPYVHPVEPQANVTNLHMVRNPFQTAVSSFLYHTQEPTPESWVRHTRPCLLRHPAPGSQNQVDAAKERAASLGLSAVHIDELFGLCHRLIPEDTTDYYAHLLKMEQYEALRLETIRITLNALLLMGVNSKIFAEHWPYYLQSCLDDSMAESDVALLNIGRAIGKNVSEAFVNFFVKRENEIVEHQKGKKKKKHVTSSFVTKQKRNEWITKLRADPIIGPILSRIEQEVGCKPP